ncbi:MAG: thioesterase family protein [Candidatus Dadabacteria bacterium]|jgi:acyl-CoA thioesterase FadM|nr:thioesterase family protein [Candidatus Dadabacteria bacterium]MCZ6638931.1 thioesterase family protein [Candidatus Dadabacteria bacterium]MCZ6791323.1 thioesterase family protein [Candidatus Dadabacteria bacterium]MCZ6865455.1 thioesterase family protein [Candidatus Dadabacteria bacterium]
MARIKITPPKKFDFSTEISLRISDINYGGHLGHDSILSLAHEARVRFFKSHGFTELNVFGPAMILSDVAIYYKSEGFYGDSIVIDIAVCDYLKYGCDLVYRLTEKKTGRVVALLKTGIVFIYYEKREVAPVPKEFKKLFRERKYSIEIQSKTSD